MFLLLFLGCVLPFSARADSVTVTITVDNGYGFGFGDQNGIYAGQYYGGVDNCTAAEIFGSPCYVFVPPDGTVMDTGPEIYNITAGANDYIYIVGWSDDAAFEGAIASFVDNTTGTTVTTSPSWPWQVYATGFRWAPNCTGAGQHGPPLTGFPYAINNQISVANASAGVAGTSSVGWVGSNPTPNGALCFGGNNNGYKTFNYPYGIPACLAPGVTWMEYDPAPTNPGCDPFFWNSVAVITNNLREYLIYRIGPLGSLTTSNTCSNGCINLNMPTNLVIYSCGNCAQAFYTPTASDICGCAITSITCNPPSGTCFPTGISTVTVTASDACGTQTTCAFTVDVICTNCLNVQCAADKTVQCGTSWSFDTPVATTCCTNQIITPVGTATNLLITSTGIVTNGTCPQFITQTWTITDGCGNTTNCAQTVTVVGCCNCLQVQCAQSKIVQCGTVWSFDPPQATTCCGGNSAGGSGPVTIVPTGVVTNGVCPQVFVTENWMIGDGCGNTTNCSQTVEIIGCCTNPPCLTVQCPPAKTVQCGTPWTFDPPVATTCCAQTVPGTRTNLLITPAGAPVTNGVCPSVTVTQYWNIIDGCGNGTQCSQVVTILGCCNCLTVQCPTNKSVSCNSAWSFDPPTGTTCCSNAAYPPILTITPLGTVTNGTCPQLAITEMWMISDFCGNTTNCSQTVTITNCCNTPPCLGVQCAPDKTVQCGSTWTFDAPVATTCCTAGVTGTTTNLLVIPTGAVTNGACPLVTVTESWTIIDGCGDTTNCSQTVTVLGCCDCLNVQCPSNKVVQCGSTWAFDLPTATTCCSNTSAGTPGTVTIVPVGTVTNGACPQVFVTENWLIYDGCGNTTNCSQTVEIVGCCTNPPCLTVQCPAAKTVKCGSQWNFDPPIATTCCTKLIKGPNGPTNIVVTPTGTVTNGACPLVTITQTWNIIDGCGDTAQCSQVMTVVGCCDCLQVQCPQNKTVPCDVAWSFDQPVAATCCSNAATGLPANITITPTVAVTNGACPLVTVTEIWTITDDCGNTTNCSQTVTILGCCTTPPCLSVQCPPDKTVKCDMPWTFDLPRVKTCCQNTISGTTSYYLIIPTSTVTNGACPAETITQSWNIIDGCGDSTNCSQVVTVLGCCDCLQVQCPPSKAVPCDVAWTFDPPTATTCCTNNSTGAPGGVTIIPVGAVTNGACPVVNVTETWIIVDGCGNRTNCSQTVTVLGCCSNPPCLSVQCPSAKTVDCGVSWTFNPPIVTTCCKSNISGTTNKYLIIPTGTVTNGVCPLVTVTQTWNIIDGCGQSTNCSQVVTILGCCNCLHVQCTTNKTVQCGTSWNFNAPTGTTCCPDGVVHVVRTGAVTNGVCPKVATATWSVYDDCGNSATCQQVVTMVDTTPPVIVCPSNIIVVPLNTNCQLVIPAIAVSATDNCTPLCSLVYSQSPPAGSIYPPSSVLVTITVTDLCGNSSTCVVAVTGVPRRGINVTWPVSLTASNCEVPCASNSLVIHDCYCNGQGIHVTQTPACGTLLGPGINSITVTVTDCAGYTVTHVIPLVVPANISFLSSLTNTGLSASGVLLPTGAVDPHYTLGPVALPAPSGYVVPRAITVTNLWGWLEVVHVSEWIAPTAYLNLYTCRVGNYTYTNKFTLPSGANPLTASISGRWAADDGATAMYINGTLTGNTVTPSGFGHWTPFTISSGFINGQNTIRFVVTNVYNQTPSGLRVEFTNASVCSTCAPPNIIWTTGTQTLQAGGTATLAVTAGGTPPFTYQWQFNGSNIAGATTTILQVPSVAKAVAGQYGVIVVGPCGVITHHIPLTVTDPLPWPNGIWNVDSVSDPLAATVGPDLTLSGTLSVNDFAIGAGSTVDLGLPTPGGTIVNAMEVAQQSGAGLNIPPILPSDASDLSAYTLIMDVYKPASESGNPDLLYASDYVSNLSSGGQDGLTLTLDASNYLHITTYAQGVTSDTPSSAPLAGDTWNRIALVVAGPQANSLGGSVTGYINGAVNISPFICPCCILNVTNTLNWHNQTPQLLSGTLNGYPAGDDLYVTGLQFHATAMSPQMIAGIGGPDSGPAPTGLTLASEPPALSATLVGGQVNISWVGTPYALQESTDLSNGQWMDSNLPFTETDSSTGGTLTTVTAKPSPQVPAKFYRLVFRP